MEGLVDIDIVTREVATQHQVAVVVVLDKTYLAGPRRVSASPIASIDKRRSGRAPAVKPHQSKIEIYPASLPPA
jgi:hypothetical protein